MSEPTREREPSGDGGSPRPSTGRPTGRTESVLRTEEGRTTIADSVVAKVVGVAARGVPGVYDMGAGMSRALGAVRQRVGGGDGVTQGVSVEVGERQAAFDLDVVVEYGVSIPDVATGIRRSTISAVEKMCGLEVTEVNINVDDVHLPGDETEQREPRVE